MIRTLLRELSKDQMKIEGRCFLLYQYLLFFFLDVRCTINVQVNVSLIHIKSARNTYLNFIFERLQLLSAEVFVHFDCRKKIHCFGNEDIRSYREKVGDFSFLGGFYLPVIALHPGGISSEHVGPVHSLIQSHWLSSASLTMHLPPFSQGLLKQLFLNSHSVPGMILYRRVILR